MKIFNMSKIVKTKIYQLPESIEDETVLNQVMEEGNFYATKKDIVDEITPDQLKELDKLLKKPAIMKPFPGMILKKK